MPRLTNITASLVQDIDSAATPTSSSSWHQVEQRNSCSPSHKQYLSNLHQTPCAVWLMQEFSSLTVAGCPFSALSALLGVAGCNERSKEDCYHSHSVHRQEKPQGSCHNTFHQHQRCETLESTLEGNAIPIGATSCLPALCEQRF